MRAWLLERVTDLSHGTEPLRLVEREIPKPDKNEVLIRVSCCGVCHTELDEIEGRTPPSIYPVVPGHQVVGTIVQKGSLTSAHEIGERVGVAWICSSCGECEFCLSDRENLCTDFVATGRDHDGGYSDYLVVDERFAYRIPSVFTDEQAAPLLCAGAIGYRSLRLANLKDGDALGLSGFGASGHLILKTARHLFPRSSIYVFARNVEERDFARSLGCDWTGDFSSVPPAKLNAVIDTTPVWSTIVSCLRHLKPGGRMVINAIRKEARDIQALTSISYEDHLWMEKEIKSVANITRKDVDEFLKLAAEIPIKPEVEIYEFKDANKALLDLKQRHVRGAKVLRVHGSDELH